MSFLRIFPLKEIENVADEDFGNGNPARCLAQSRFGAREYYLNINDIAAFEECPLYLICKAETDALVNGIRIKLRSGEMMVLPDDPEKEEAGFINLLARAGQGEIVEMEYSHYMRELEDQKLI